MNTVPIAFCFDDTLEVPAGVCITSLLENANDDTFYDIFILYPEKSKSLGTSKIKELPAVYQNCKITFRPVENPFEGGYEIRGITNSAYLRLLIPELIPEYDKIMYHDVDVIFRKDLSKIFEDTNIANFYIAGVNSPGGLTDKIRTKRNRQGYDWKSYILSGDLILNSKLLRDDKIVDDFRYEVKNSKYEYQDMDIINKVCKDKIKRMPPEFCGTIEIFRLATYKVQQILYTQVELNQVLKEGIVHYNGPKPWIKYCPNYDIWWEYYRKSIFFDAKFYFDFFNTKMDEYDRLPLWKRIKILLRYFKTGGMKKGL